MDKITASAWEIRPYRPEDSTRWNSFAAEARNSTFLFQRSYMDYHSDRFADMSLIALRSGKPLAMLPANIDGSILRSHGGLTYGGWILPRHHLDASDMLSMWEAWLSFCVHEGITEIDYKPLPFIYSLYPSQEDEYLLFRFGATLTERNLSSTVDLRSPRGFNTLMRRHLRKAVASGVTVVETRCAAPFMRMLSECLRERHGATPVHSEAELLLLMERFPDNIRIFITGSEDAPAAGVCVYDTGLVAHAQYIATTAEGRAANLLPLIFHRLITETFAGRRYFDFGISNENHGLLLNAGLLRQKSALGGTGTVYSRYKITL